MNAHDEHRSHMPVTSWRLKKYSHAYDVMQCNVRPYVHVLLSTLRNKRTIDRKIKGIRSLGIQGHQLALT